MNSGSVLFAMFGACLGIFSFVLSSTRFLNCLIILENVNVLILFCCLLLGVTDERSFFVALLVMFTVEVVLGLVVLTRVWSSGSLIGLLGW